MEADEWIHEASKKIQALEEETNKLREMLRKERKKKKRWKNKYLELLVDYNELKTMHDDMCKTFQLKNLEELNETLAHLHGYKDNI